MRRLLSLLFVLPCLLLAQTPANPMEQEAIESFKKQDYDNSRMLFESVLADNPRDQVAQNYLRMIAQKQHGANSGAVALLKQTIIPKVDFTDVSAREAFDFVSQKVRDLSTDKKPLNIVWLVPADADPRVTLNLQNTPASDVMRYIAEAAGLKLDYDAYAVKVSAETK